VITSTELTKQKNELTKQKDRLTQQKDQSDDSVKPQSDEDGLLSSGELTQFFF